MHSFEESVPEIHIISNLPFSKSCVSKHFKPFKNTTIIRCYNNDDCDYHDNENHYAYYIEFMNKNPFGLTIIIEGEKAPEYGAFWEAQYIWVLGKWFLFKKLSKGIS